MLLPLPSSPALLAFAVERVDEAGNRHSRRERSHRLRAGTAGRSGLPDATATRMEQHCDDKPPPGRASHEGPFAWWQGQSALGPRETSARAARPSVDCRLVPVQREFRRPIAFDVDYMYKGMKYRSRLPEDPGNRLRVRVSVTPWVAPASDR